MKIDFRIPYPENENFSKDLPAVPQVGDTIELTTGPYRVKRVVWFFNDPDVEETTPYLILWKGSE